MSSEPEGEMRLAVEVPASVANLGPGFDALGIALDLRNRYEFTLTKVELPTPPRILISGEGADSLPCNTQHLAYRGCVQVLSLLGIDIPNIQIAQHNCIPFAGGLGNSATAVVAGVLAANAFSGGRLTPDECLNQATELEGHPDNVAPALLGGMVVCAGSQSGVTHLRVPLPQDLYVVLAVPDFTLNTVLARQVLPSHVPLADAAFNVGHASILVAAILTGQLQHLAAAMQDKLHQPYRAHLVPGMEVACREACKAGALGSALAGAGPTVMAFSMGLDSATRIGEVMVSAFTSAGIKARAIVTRPCSTGATTEQLVPTTYE